MNKTLTIRTIIEIDTKNIPDVYAPQAVVIKGEKADGSSFKVDIGRICYTIREEDSGNLLHKSKRYVTGLVDTASLSSERVIWLQKFLSDSLSRSWRDETLRAKLHYLRYFFNYCDFDGSKPNTLESLIVEYNSYQTLLYQRGRVSSKSSLSETSIYGRLATARRFIQLAFSLSNAELLQLIPKPRYKTSNITKETRTICLQDSQNYLQACILYFNQFSDAILENRYPISITSSEHPLKDMYWHAPSGTTLKNLPNCFDKSGNPLPFNLIKETLEKNFTNKYSASQFYQKTLIQYRNEWINGYLTSKKIYAYNISTFCFFHIYLAFTAANVQPTLDLKITDLDLTKIGSQSFAKKHKYRAGRKVEFNAPNHLKRALLKYLKLREWAENLGLPEETRNFLFINISEKRTLKRLDRSKANSIIDNSILFKDIIKPNSRELRLLSGEFFIRKSKGKVSLVAKKLNNSIATTAKSYTSIDVDSQAIEMNKYHEEMRYKILKFNRTTSEIIPVKLSTDNTVDRVAAGSCANSLGGSPTRAYGFNNEAPEPICGTFESCLFCEFFTVHIDFEDIHKLCSLKEALLQSSILRNDSEHHQAVIEPAIFRINEILTYLRKKSETSIGIIHEVEEKIEMGVYNEHWNSQIQVLTAAINNNHKCELRL
jgi:hypothetical protein